MKNALSHLHLLWHLLSHFVLVQTIHRQRKAIPIVQAEQSYHQRQPLLHKAMKAFIYRRVCPKRVNQIRLTKT